MADPDLEAVAPDPAKKTEEKQQAEPTGEEFSPATVAPAPVLN